MALHIHRKKGKRSMNSMLESGPLEFVSTVVVPATSGMFIAKDKFIAKTTSAPKISYLSDNFRKFFLEGEGKKEPLIEETTLLYMKLREFSVDGPIIEKLGGKERSETTLSEMFFLMENQGGGENGVLLTNGYANIFYVKDVSGLLRSVCAHWHRGGWGISAYSVECYFKWNIGRQVFFRNSAD